jgi:uncharacterized membrane protein
LWVPFPYETVLATGVCEIFGAVGLMTRRWRRVAAWLLAAYAVCVFPANIKHLIDDIGTGTGLGWFYHGPRMVAQPLIVWWTLLAGGILRWPFGHAEARDSRNPEV